jgi:hypothetical protein
VLNDSEVADAAMVTMTRVDATVAATVAALVVGASFQTVLKGES